MKQGGERGRRGVGWLDDGAVDFEVQVDEAIDGSDYGGWVRPYSSSSSRTRPVTTL